MTTRITVLTLLATAMLFGQTVKPTSYPEITGDAATHQFAASGSCRAIQIVIGGTAVANASLVRLGDSTTSVTKGLPFADGTSWYMPPLTVSTKQGLEQQYYSLSDLYYFAATGDKVNFTCLK